MNANEASGFSQRIRAHRRRTGQTQQQLAERLGVTRLTVVNWEKGVWPGKNLAQLTDELRTTEREEITITSEPEPSEAFTYQLSLPFDEPINVSLRVGPRTADSLHFEVHFERKTGS
jgi:DNA-binding XRE family transcriptional regulator